MEELGRSLFEKNMQHVRKIDVNLVERPFKISVHFSTLTPRHTWSQIVGIASRFGFKACGTNSFCHRRFPEAPLLVFNPGNVSASLSHDSKENLPSHFRDDIVNFITALGEKVRKRELKLVP